MYHVVLIGLPSHQEAAITHDNTNAHKNTRTHSKKQILTRRPRNLLCLVLTTLKTKDYLGFAETGYKFKVINVSKKNPQNRYYNINRVMLNRSEYERDRLAQISVSENNALRLEIGLIGC